MLNLAGLLVLVVGILYLNQWRAGLIDARVQSLRVQGEIIAAAVAASATVDSDVISVNPDRLLELQGDGTVSPLSYFDPTLEFPINPERVAPLLRNLITPTRTRARIYDQGGLMILDSDNIYAPRRGDAADHRHQADGELFPLGLVERRPELGAGRQFPANTRNMASTRAAAIPKSPRRCRARRPISCASMRRTSSWSRWPCRCSALRAVVGAILLSTAPGDIDSIVAQERWGILRIALIAAAVQIALSLALAGTIAGPMRRLSEAAERVQTAGNARAEIPDFTDRPDEIGHLAARSGA